VAVSPESWPMSHDTVLRLDSIGAEVRIDVRLDVGERRGAPAADPASAASSPTLGPCARSPHAGGVVGGRYELVRLIGQGSMGAVWLANHITLGERVALKMMAPTVDTGAVEDASTSAARFRFEAQIAARLSRKTRHVVRVTDHGQEGPLPYLVMELLEGQTLEKALLCHGPMGVAEVSGVVTQIARGLEAAHSEGILHRDLKPANVFLADSGEGRPVVKLLDFGVARGHFSQRVGAPFATAKGLVMGTPGYMSPEQAAASEIDVRSDLWSLAAIAYEALTCELPVAGRDAEHLLSNLRACRTVPIRERRPDLPESLEHFFQRAFAPRIEDRHSTCAELANAFVQAVQLGAVGAVTRRLLTRPRVLPGRPLPVVPDLRPGAQAKTYSRLAVAALVAGAGLLGVWYAWPGSVRSRSALGEASALAMPGGAQAAAARSTQLDGFPPPPTALDPTPPMSTQVTAPSPVVISTPRPARPPSSELGEFKAYY
jgi:serine/threonine protein kinase